MKNAGWMLSLLGSVIGGFTAWAERLPHLRFPLSLPHGHIPGFEITATASALALVAITVMWTQYSWVGSILVMIATIAGLFGADQLWTTAACVLFCGAVLTLFSPPKRLPSAKTRGNP